MRRWPGPRSSSSGMGIPTLLPLFAGILPRRSTVTLRSHLRALRNDFTLAMAQIALLTTMLAHQAWLMCDAIGRTLWRVFVTRRHMLEWIPADLLGGTAQHLPQLLRAHVPRRVAGARRRGADDSPGGRPAAAHRTALPDVVAGRAGRGLAHQPDAAVRRQVRAVVGAAARPAADREAHLALLRDLRHGRGQPPAAGQLPGRPARRGGAPHFAHQHRALSTVHRRGARLRLVRPARCAGSHRGHARHAVAHGPAPRPSLQLVRHARPAPAGTSLRLLGGLGQSRGAPDDAGRRVSPVAAGSAAARRGGGGTGGFAGPGARGVARVPFRAGTAHHARAGRNRVCRSRIRAAAARRVARSRRSTTWPRPRSAPRRWSTWCARWPPKLTSSATATWCTGSKPPAAPSTAGAATCWRAIRPASLSNTSRRSPTTRSNWRAPWSSASCSTRSASCSPSAIAPPTARWIRPATTCSPPKRGWRVSSPLPRGISRRGIGSASGARSRPSAPARRWCPGPARCSST